MTAASTIYQPIITIIGILLVSAALFYIWPGIDLWASSWFYRPGSGFYLGKTTLITTIRSLGMVITVATIIGLAVVAVLWQLSPDAVKRWPSPTPRTDWWFITLGMALGPGLLVNLFFKPFWGRARPVHITEFGGHDQFTAAWAISRQCAWNCSFVSGEAAGSAFILAFCFIVPERWRRPTLLAGIAMTLADSFARMAAGGHFLSDVVTAWLLMGLLMLVLRAQIYHGRLLGPLKRWWPIN